MHLQEHACRAAGPDVRVFVSPVEWWASAAGFHLLPPESGPIRHRREPVTRQRNATASAEVRVFRSHFLAHGLAHVRVFRS